MPHTTTMPKWTINLFFMMGVSAATAIRTLAALNHYRPAWVSPTWRFAMVCYIFFFGYRFYIARKRRRVVIGGNLIRHIESAEDLPPECREALLYLLQSTLKSKELINYAFICILSVSALLLDVMLG